MEWLRGKCIGRGAFGTVHLAVDTATGTAFAVKSVDAKSAPAAAMACLESEIRILKRLSSPHVVAYLGDDGATGATRNLHMELVPGGSAAEAAAAAHGGLGERGARGVLRSVAAALRYLHEEAGVVHGDVKGRNVLLGCPRDAQGQGCGGAKLADFGAARLVSDDAATTPRGPRGTPAWMAPEVARGGVATPASDVWALGCTALELLTGNRPWSELGGASEVGELLLLVGFGGKRPAIPACLSDACRDFLDKCLRRDAAQRWSCEQLLRHPFLSTDAGDDASEPLPWPSPSPSPSPRAVLDWAPSDTSDSEAMDDDAETESKHDEVMARAKGRVAELASNVPRTSWDWEEVEWGTGATWATDTWAPPASSEAPRISNASALVVPSAAAFSDGRDRDVVVLAVGSGSSSGLRCGHGRPGCHSHRCRYKCGSGVVGVGLGWPPLAVVPVPVLVLCTVVPFVHPIQSKFVSNQAANELCTPFAFCMRSSLIGWVAVHDRVDQPSEPPRIDTSST
ncbi:mitogen-activated protein kinase kinase kinase 2 [Sorghum bicolor]|uniref:mitogen-activated protein kinase kinase kinase 2 n=1 Tax=Sorghum bicolor TaxID=4558 RepID=UPI000B4255E8|nr:mitogen-activated protein kinase kinase kinase 2 [Sorghum bicolor]|eukprot:XP_002468033.2 mitogen-activated protein kinase kinase kinase 2 [Sorghum bicolor]